MYAEGRTAFQVSESNAAVQHCFKPKQAIHSKVLGVKNEIFK